MTSKPRLQDQISSGFEAVERAAASLATDDAAADSFRAAVADLRAVLLEERQRLHAMAMLGTLTGGLAHDLHSPLTSVVGGLHEALAAFDGPRSELDTAELGEALRDSLAAADAILRIARDMQLLAGAVDDRMGPVDLGPVLETARRLVGARLRGSVELDREAGDAPPVWASELRLGQALCSVLVRAAEGGGPVRVATHADEAWVTVEVTKSGGVIDGGDVELDVARRMVRELGGTMETTHHTTGTSTLVVRLRRALGPSRITTPLPTRLRVLAIDDEALMLRVLRRLLREHEVVAVQTGAHALELLEAGERFDLVLCDLMMPELSGAELFDVIADRFPELSERMGFITGGALTPETTEFLNTTRTPWLAKPFQVDELKRLVLTLAGPRADEIE
jgi:two-component system, NtrC family, sensor kinase